MTAPGRPGPGASDDPVAALRAAVERVLIPVETRLEEWAVALPAAMSGPVCTPLLRERLAQLRGAAQRCRAAGDAMTAAVGAVPDTPPADDSSADSTAGEVGLA